MGPPTHSTDLVVFWNGCCSQRHHAARFCQSLVALAKKKKKKIKCQKEQMAVEVLSGSPLPLLLALICDQTLHSSVLLSRVVGVQHRYDGVPSHPHWLFRTDCHCRQTLCEFSNSTSLSTHYCQPFSAVHNFEKKKQNKNIQSMNLLVSIQPTYYEFNLTKGYLALLVMYILVEMGTSLYKYSWYGPNTFVSINFTQVCATFVMFTSLPLKKARSSIGAPVVLWATGPLV